MTKLKVSICELTENYLNNKKYFSFLLDKYDPGWNDPPIFTYDKAAAIQATATKRGVSLNKRVAYPMSGKAMNVSAGPGASATPPSLPQMKPPPACTSLITKQSDIKAGECEIEKLGKSERLIKVLKNLEAVSENDDEEINKRIKIMQKMWLEDKLGEHVQLKLVDLTEGMDFTDEWFRNNCRAVE